MLRTFLLLAALSMPLAVGAQEHATPDLNIRIRGFRDRVNLDTLVFFELMPANAAMTYRATLSVLESLRIKATYADSGRGMIHHSGFVARGRLGGRNMSQFFRCGTGPSGDHADTWRLSIAYVIHVKPSGDQAELGLGVAAGAQDVEGASKPPVSCASTGALLKLISEKVGQKLVQ